MKFIIMILLIVQFHSNAFADTLELHLGKKRVYRILNITFKKAEIDIGYKLNKQVIIKSDFSDYIGNLVLKTIAPKDKDSNEWLSNGLMRFLQDYASYYIKQYPDSREIIFDQKTANEFIYYQKSHCGEIPCSVPPCCGDECDPC